MSDKELVLQIYLQEYEKLKAEQTARIGFRDNLLYVTLGIFGAILSFTSANVANRYALLVLPWVCLILGWTYLVNDEKISAIGRYIRHTLVEKIGQELGTSTLNTIFGWEVVHRSDDRRKRRKIEQLIVDEVAFVLSGIAGLVAFWATVHQPHWGVRWLSIIELLLLIILGIEIVIHADLAKNR
jgi:hypothetical protein